MDRPIPLEDIPKEEWQKLKARVKKANGKVVLIMHPFHMKHPLENYEKVLYNFLSRPGTPVVILEKYTDIERTEAKIQGLFEKYSKTGKTRPGKAKIPEHMVIHTGEVAGNPVLKAKAGKYLYDMFYSKFIDRLREAGVRTVWVGGMMAGPAKTDALEIGEYEKKRLPAQPEDRKKTRPTTAEMKKYSNVPFGSYCAGTLYANLITSRRFDQVSWLVNAGLFMAGDKVYTSPYPHPRHRRKKVVPKPRPTRRQRK